MKFLRGIHLRQTLLFFISPQARKFLLASIVVGGIYLGLLAWLTESFHIWYVWSIFIASVICLVGKFPFQKVWALENRNLARVHHQFGYYFCMEIASIGINIGAVDILVRHEHLWYVWAQCIVGPPLLAAAYAISALRIFRL